MMLPDNGPIGLDSASYLQCNETVITVNVSRECCGGSQNCRNRKSACAMQTSARSHGTRYYAVPHNPVLPASSQIPVEFAISYLKTTCSPSTVRHPAPALARSPTPNWRNCLGPIALRIWRVGKFGRSWVRAPQFAHIYHSWHWIDDLFQHWSGQQDSNLRPPGPKPGALPSCAMPRSVVTSMAYPESGCPTLPSMPRNSPQNAVNIPPICPTFREKATGIFGTPVEASPVLDPTGETAEVGL